jgi:ankyrin repeat protein
MLAVIKGVKYGASDGEKAAATGAATRLLVGGGVDVTETDGNGRNALWWACYKGLDAVALLRLLDIGGVDVDAKDSDDGTNVLWNACCAGLDEVALRLLDIGGVDVDASRAPRVAYADIASWRDLNSQLRFLN